MTLLAVDVETTGLIRGDLPPDHKDQPAALQIGAVLVGDDWREIAAISLLLRPDDDWFVSQKAMEVNGLSVRDVRLHGLDPELVMRVIWEMSRKTQRIIAYGSSFDRTVLVSMMRRCGLDPEASITRPRVRWIDVMSLATFPAGTTREDGTPRWPKLTEAVDILLEPEIARTSDLAERKRAAGDDCSYERERARALSSVRQEFAVDAHSAIVDARATIEIYRVLYERGLVPEAA